MNMSSLPQVSIQVMNEVIAWAADAAREQAEIAIHQGADLDPDGNLGLWLSFREKFKDHATPGTYDVYVSLYSNVYSETMKAISALQKKA